MARSRLSRALRVVVAVVAVAFACAPGPVWCTSASGHAAIELGLIPCCTPTSPSSSAPGCHDAGHEPCTDVALASLGADGPTLPGAAIAPRAAVPDGADRINAVTPTAPTPQLVALRTTVLLS